MKKIISLLVLFLFFACIPFVYCDDTSGENDKQKDSQFILNKLNNIPWILVEQKKQLKLLSKEMRGKQKQLETALLENTQLTDSRLNKHSEQLAKLKNKSDFSIWTSIMVPLIAAIGGASIAGFFSILTMKKAHENEMNKQKQQERRALKNLLQSLKDEIGILWNTYKWGVGNELKNLPPMQPLEIYYPVTQEYFVVYNNNQKLIGSIDNDELRTAIVEGYTMAKSFIDSFRLNNEFVAKSEHWHWLFIETGDPAHAARAEAQKKVMIDYAETLKEIHVNLEQKIKNLVSLIESEQTKMS